MGRFGDRPTHEAGWTPERVERLTQLWADGKSAAEIALLLGGGLTRNGVIGKVHRLKLDARVAAKRRSTNPVGFVIRAKNAAAAGAKTAHEAIVSAATSVDEKNVRALRSKAWDALPGTAPVPLLDLGKGQCNWPIGDRPMLFCAAAVEGEHRYCPNHARMGRAA